MKFVVVAQHRSEYPEPITFAKGAELVVGECYAGEEGWDNWYLCSTPGQQDGWVPGQVSSAWTATGAGRWRIIAPASWMLIRAITWWAVGS